MVTARMRLRAAGPPSLSQVVNYKMAFDRNPFLKVAADKLATRDYLASQVGQEYLPPLVFASTDADTIISRLPLGNFVLKPNNSSGSILIVSETVRDSHPLSASELLSRGAMICHPRNIVYEELRSVCSEWLARRYEWRPGIRAIEWAYEGVPTKLMVEELLLDQHLRLPSDYKFHVIAGRVEFINVMSRYQDNKSPTSSSSTVQSTLLARDWRPMPVAKEDWRHHQVPVEVPTRSTEMVELAEYLGTASDYLRVDMYSVDGSPFIGELTPYPNAGRHKFRPRSFSRQVVRRWAPTYGPRARFTRRRGDFGVKRRRQAKK